MAKKQINPTRMELTRLKRKLVTAIRGHKLLKDKRDELMRQFLELIRRNRRLRTKVEAGLASAAKDFALARATMRDELLDTALLAPNQRLSLEVDVENIMSVIVPRFNTKTRDSDKSNMFSYGFAFTSADLDQAVGNLGSILPDMLELAEVEKQCQLIAAEIEKTRRRVNALEYVMIPEMQESIKYISMKLDENERGNQIRLMKIKSMILEDAHQYSAKS